MGAEHRAANSARAAQGGFPGGTVLVVEKRAAKIEREGGLLEAHAERRLVREGRRRIGCGGA